MKELKNGIMKELLNYCFFILSFFHFIILSFHCPNIGAMINFQMSLALT